MSHISVDRLSPQRLDVMAKLPFAEAYIQNRIDPWASRLFRDFLLLSNGGPQFSENGKRTISDYENSFRAVIDSISSEGFREDLSSIPFTSGGISNGAHRLAACIALGQEPKYRQVDDDQSEAYGYRYMRKILVPDQQIEYMVWRYLCLKPDARLLLLTNVSKVDAVRILDRLRHLIAGPEIYMQTLDLNSAAKKRLMFLTYGHLEWWHPSLAEPMVAERFLMGDRGNHIVYFETTSDSQTSQIKTALRAEFKEKIGFERQIHGSDNHYETLRIAEAALNSLSRWFMNISESDAESRILGLIQSEGPRLEYFTENDWCIDGSAVLEMFGIRQARDVDFISCSGATNNFLWDNHNAEYVKYSTSPDEVIFDPRRHWRYAGVKFMSLAELAGQKSLVLEEKSKNDLALISDFLNGRIYQYSKSRVVGHQFGWRIRVGISRTIEQLLCKLPQGLASPIRRGLRWLARKIFN